MADWKLTKSYQKAVYALGWVFGSLILFRILSSVLIFLAAKYIPT